MGGGFLKRLFDFMSAMISLMLLSPVFVLIWAIIKVDSKGSALFCQRRVGVGDKEFSMYKFRTMVIGTPEVATDKLNDSQHYITKVGYYLRKYSLDELPQLVNILRGDMSIVGPRPALYNQYDLRRARNELRVSNIKPGLTGWAQVNGRDEISLEEKVRLDLYYLENRSFLLDIQIIYHTVFSVCAGNGVKVKV